MKMKFWITVSNGIAAMASSQGIRTARTICAIMVRERPPVASSPASPSPSAIRVVCWSISIRTSRWMARIASKKEKAQRKKIAA